MSDDETSAVRILVAGDVVQDHFVYEGTRNAPYALRGYGTENIKTLGGAHQLFELVEAAVAQPLATKRALGDASVEGRRVVVESGMDTAHRAALAQSYGLWGACAAADGKGHVWRVTRPLGYGDCHNSKYCTYPSAPPRAAAKADIVVIDDAGLGFRHGTNRHAWPEEVLGDGSDSVEWVILKMSAPVAHGDLWRQLRDRFHDRLVVVVSADDLRKEEVSITKGRSWEHTAEDLVVELTRNKIVSDLAACRHLVVSFDTDGALWLDNDAAAGPTYRLVFDPSHLEAEWKKEKIEGHVWGGTTCLVAGIACELSRAAVARGTCAPPSDVSSAAGSMVDGIMRGLAAAREAHRLGHGPVTDDVLACPRYPLAALAAAVRPNQEKHGRSVTADAYSVAEVPACIGEGPCDSQWSIISGTREPLEPKPLYGLARQVALAGAAALGEVPYARFGKLFAVDRVEIESLRGIHDLIKGYESEPHPPRPLCIAVFGAPGSGKSFGVKQIAKGLLGKDAPILEFNLSQFSEPAELVGALHRVRDEVLSGFTPCVFWDEFDSRQYFWLQYLLAPMQDGRFQDGQISHPIGKCVFVFAGGTSCDFANFGPPPDDEETDTEGLTRYDRFKLLKGPDFVSRLSGYLDIAGPNRRQTFDRELGRWIDSDRPADISFPVRRALLLRDAAGLHGSEVLDIDEGLLTAILEISTFKHGVRSLQTLVQLTKSRGGSAIRRSALPPLEQISLHVDPVEFMSLVGRDLAFKMHSDDLAPQVHQYYRELVKRGSRHEPSDKSWSDLSDESRASNVAAAARIPRVLGGIGLMLVRGEHPGALSKDEAARIIETNIEQLAAAEHEGWMEEKYREGFRKASHKDDRDDERKLHPSLVPYKELSPEDKAKDVDLVLHYPVLIEKAGYVIVPAGAVSRT